MADLLSSVSPIALPATLLSPGALPGAPNLAAFIELMAGQAATAPATGATSIAGGGDRQDDAATGTLLPDSDGDHSADPALAWLLAGQMAITPPAAPVATPAIAASAVAVPTPSIPTDAQATASMPSAVRAPLTIGAQDEVAAPSSSASTTPIDPSLVAMTMPSPLPGREESGVDRPARIDTTLVNVAVGQPVVLKNGEAISSNPPTPNPSLPGRGIAPFQPVATGPVDALPSFAAIATASIDPLADIGIPVPTASSSIAAAPPIAAVTGSDVAIPTPAAPIVRNDVGVSTDPEPTLARSRAPIVSTIAPRPIPSPHPITMLSPAIAPSAVLPALFALAAADRTSDRDDRLTSPVSLGATAAPVTIAAAVAPTADAQRQTLDMGRHDWPQRMIEHIETLRDDANARDTSIRLKPEALGRVDVALKTHDDGAVSVRFTAEQPTTRALIADAAPQLREAAEARGIRLSQTSVDLSHQGGEQRARPGVDPRQPTTNHLAVADGDDTDAVADGRIA